MHICGNIRLIASVDVAILVRGKWITSLPKVHLALSVHMWRSSHDRLCDLCSQGGGIFLIFVLAAEAQLINAELEHIMSIMY